jgi:hypothetical protein
MWCLKKGLECIFQKKSSFLNLTAKKKLFHNGYSLQLEFPLPLHQTFFFLKYHSFTLQVLLFKKANETLLLSHHIPTENSLHTATTIQRILETIKSKRDGVILSNSFWHLIMNSPWKRKKTPLETLIIFSSKVLCELDKEEKKEL